MSLAGGGRGWRNWFWATGVPNSLRGGPGALGSRWNVSPDVERNVLEDRAQALQNELDQTRQRLSEIGPKPGSDAQ